MAYKHRDTGRIISNNEYYHLPDLLQIDYKKLPEADSGDFLTSAVIGSVTDSALLGGLLGGDLAGGIVGDLLDGDLFD
jgi:hypothetical protein